MCRSCKTACGIQQQERASSNEYRCHRTAESSSDVTIPRRQYELLLLKKRALDSIKEGITIADCSQPDMPIIYANEAFARLTGYSTEYAIGRNCRFLQGYAE